MWDREALYIMTSRYIDCDYREPSCLSFYIFRMIANSLKRGILTMEYQLNDAI
jgi:hypothetical protein